LVSKIACTDFDRVARSTASRPATDAIPQSFKGVSAEVADRFEPFAFWHSKDFTMRLFF
jgi:hypothetical protein